MYLMKLWLKFSEPGTFLVVQCFHCRGHRFRNWPGNYLPKVIKIMRWGGVPGLPGPLWCNQSPYTWDLGGL